MRRASAIARAVLRHGPGLAALVEAARASHGPRPVLVTDGEAWSAEALWTLAARRASRHRGTRAPIVTAETGARLVATIVAADLLGRAVLPVDTRLHGEAALEIVPPASRRGILTLTTGSTGAPRATRAATGAAHGRRMLALHRAIGLRTSDVVLSCTPLQHGHGLSLLASSLLAGATLVDAAHRSPSARLAAMREHEATVLSAVPVQLERLLDAGEPLPPLRRVVSGSEPLSPALARRAIEAWGPIVLQAYGTTETGTVTVAPPATLAHDPTTVGAPLPGVRLAIEARDGDGVGRVRIATGGRVHRTDDLGSLRDGLLRLHGRVGGPRPTATLDAVHTTEGPETGETATLPA